ncbi:hypothetical protein ACFZAM_31465 [Streptomyces sp. NPDC008079]|uniref:hypothetical protein n=1 Tax=Streptomyces sp. NPDC008079 TaxID=3364806 RepID=UPI0036E73ABC
MTANTTTTDTFTFRKGGSAAEEADQAARDANRGHNGPDYFGIKDDQGTIAIRVLTDHDDWIFAEQHSFVPTKAAPKDAGDNWPKSMTAVCRHDEAFEGHYSDCYICDNKLKNNFGKTAVPQVRVWALAIERELVRGDGSDALGGPSKKDMLIGVRDKIEEIDELNADGKPTGTTLRYPKVLIINQPMKSFFGPLRALNGLYGTVCDRDMIVTRDGTGTDTTYRFSSLDPMPDIKPGTPEWQKYEQVLAEREINLSAIVADKASDAYYARFFNPAFDVDKDGNVLTAGSPRSSLATAESSGSYDPALKERIRALSQPTNG